MKNSLQSVTTLPVAVKMMKGIVIDAVVPYRKSTPFLKLKVPSDGLHEKCTFAY